MAPYIPAHSQGLHPTMNCPCPIEGDSSGTGHHPAGPHRTSDISFARSYSIGYRPSSSAALMVDSKKLVLASMLSLAALACVSKITPGRKCGGEVL
jgi:hypothetical protein